MLLAQMVPAYAARHNAGSDGLMRSQVIPVLRD
jgi:hypothetical protein